MMLIDPAIGRDLELRLTAIAETLEVPDSAYEAATARYQAVGDWLCADGSPIKDWRPTVYAQGSFALGTVIRPVDRCDYDIDAVVHLEGGTSAWRPGVLKAALGKRLRQHTTYQRMLRPEGRRCWTLDYASSEGEPGFHLDLLPATTGDGQVAAARATAIAITNREPERGYTWRASDPKGYAAWFQARTELRVGARRLDKSASVEAVPEFVDRSPLRAAVQLLKRHRDVMFVGNAAAPISVILSTLAARAYQGEAGLAEAVLGITGRMRSHVERVGDRYVIPNPVRPEENFADRWNEPAKSIAFFKWLTALEEFVAALATAAPAGLESLLLTGVGKTDTRVALRKYAALRGESASSLRTARPVLVSALPSKGERVTGLGSADAYATPSPPGAALSRTRAASVATAEDGPAGWRDAKHREPVPWPEQPSGLRIRVRAEVTGGAGARRGPLPEGRPLAPHAKLSFAVDVQCVPTDEIFWQVVNTGSEANTRRGLRGGFEAGSTTKSETTLYVGDHFIEAFVVRGGECVARTGPFRVVVR